MNDAIREITRQIARTIDISLTEAFARCGFTIDYCKEHADEFMVIENDYTKTYCHKGKQLFTEYTTIKATEDNSDIKYVVEIVFHNN